MADNDRVEYVSGDIRHEQLAPSKSVRTMFTPGKITSKAGDENWPKDYRLPIGTNNFNGESDGPVEMSRTRVVKLGRNIIDDQVIPVPVSTGTRVELLTAEDFSLCGTHSVKDMVVPLNREQIEKNSGSDNIKGA